MFFPRWDIMVKDNQSRFNRVLRIVLDALVIVISYAVAWGILSLGNRFFNPGTVLLPAQFYFVMLVGIVPLYLILYALSHLYEPKRIQSRRRELANIIRANVIGLLIITLILFLLNKHPYFHEFSRRMVFYFFAVNIVLETLERNLTRYIRRYFLAKGYNQRNILLIGYSNTAEAFIDRILGNPEWGYRVYGILDDDSTEQTEYRGIKVIGKTDDLEQILSQNTLDEIAITLKLGEYANLERLVAACEKSGVHTKFIPDYINVIPTRPYTEDYDGLPVINIRHVPLNDPFNWFVKRAVDIAGSLIGIIIFSPVMLVIAILIKITSDGPVIYSQERIGLHNRPFKMYKFRSMEVQPPYEEEKEWTTPDDPRVTSIGRFIRKTSLDEVPQFFNVIKGDMSLVGPRPERPLFVEKFKEEIPRYMIKHQVRPGMTGWAQINGYRGDTSITKRIEYDLYYIENWTLGLDFRILFMTIFKGFINKNAY